MLKVVLFFLAALPSVAFSAGVGYPPTIQTLIAHKWNPARDIDLIEKFDAEVAQMVEAEKFDDLERLVRELRSSKVLFTNGDQASHRFYLAVGGLSEDQDAKQWEKRGEAIKKWMARGPSGEALLAQASFDAQFAHRSNGRSVGQAKLATTIGHMGFREHLRSAFGFAEDAQRKLPDDPEPYYQMAATGASVGIEDHELKVLAEKSHAVDPTFPYTDAVYTSRLDHRVRGMSSRRSAEFLDKVMARPDGLGAEAYARTCIPLAKQHPAKKFFLTTAMSYEKIAKGFAVMAKRYPNSQSNFSRWSFYLIAKNDRPAAQPYLRYLQGKFDLDFWFTQRRYEHILADTEDQLSE